MKKVILGSVLAAAAAVSINAAAASGTASVCAGAGTGSVAGATDTFVKTTFTARCSNNVSLVGDDQINYYRVGGISSKGKNRFGGSSNGGAVTGEACGAATCALSDAQTAAQNAASS